MAGFRGWWDGQAPAIVEWVSSGDRRASGMEDIASDGGEIWTWVTDL